MWMPIARKMDRQIVVVLSSISAVLALIIVRKVLNINRCLMVLYQLYNKFQNSRLLKNIIILGCTFPDVEFVGGDLSKAQGGGGIKKRYDDQCIIACEKNPKCQ